MAKKLNLEAKWINDATLRISWDDVKANDQNKSMQWIVALIFFPLFLLSMFTAVSGGGFGFMGLMFVILIGMALWFTGSSTVPNHVDFSTQSVTVQGQSYPTSSITRFDYGVKSQLTGIMPQKDGNGNSFSDPTMIRMWIDDSMPVTISENRWAYNVCHEIRDALDRALQRVRSDEKEATRTAEFGDTSGEFGMPDY